MSVSSTQPAERTADELGNLESQIEGQNLEQQLIPPTHKIDAGQETASADDSSSKPVASLQAEFDAGSSKKPSPSGQPAGQTSPQPSPVSLQSANAGHQLANNPGGAEKLELPPQQDNVWAAAKK